MARHILDSTVNSFQSAFAATIVRSTLVLLVLSLMAAGSSAQTRTVTLVWTASGDDGSEGRATAYDVRYSTSPISEETWSVAQPAGGEPTPDTAGATELMAVDGLHEDSTYYFAIKVGDDADNWSPLSNLFVSHHTGPGGISDLTAGTGINSGEINLSWSAPLLSDPGTTPWAYEVRTSTGTITEDNWSNLTVYPGSLPEPAARGVGQEVILTGLAAGQRHYVGLRAVSEGQTPTPISNIVSAVTGFDVGTAVDLFTIGVSPRNNSTVKTTRPTLIASNTGTEGSFYEFQITTSSTFSSVDLTSGPLIQQSGSTTSWRVNSRLAAEQRYYWRVLIDGEAPVNSWSFVVEPHAHCFPNPYRAGVDQGVVFAEVPRDAHLTLLTVSGDLVHEWIGTGDDIAWDVTNTSGNPVTSGVYIWFVSESADNGKLVVIR